MKRTRQLFSNHLCLFCTPALYLNGIQRMDETSIYFILFMNRMDGLSPNQFKGVHMNDIPVVEDLLTTNILLYDIDIVDGNLIEEIARGSVQKYENTARLLRCKNYRCFVSTINSVIQSFS